MKIILLYNDVNRYWTVGTYIKKILVQQPEIDIPAHCRIPEDTGICRESSNPDTDLVLCIDDGTHFKLHHERNFIPKQTKTAIWLSDLHRPDWARHRLQMIREWHYDHVFYAQKNFKDLVKDQGYKDEECSWLPHAVDPEIFKPMPNIKKIYDIGYIGYKNEKRIQVENTLKNYMNFKHFTSVWAWSANRFFNELKIGFNISVEDDINMRVFETMATGIPLLTNYVNNGMEDLFGNDLENKFLIYQTEEEMKEKAVRLIANPGLREHLIRHGREHVLKFHTYRNRINTILSTLNCEMLKTI